MDLVTGIDWKNGKALALASSGESGEQSIELADLGHRGLPEAQTYARQITFNLRDLQVASFCEYAEAFGQKLRCEPRHSVWSLQLERSRLVIPALALLRAFVRPNKTLLPQLFKAQSLDDICFLAAKGSPYYVQAHGNLGKIQRTRESDIMGPSLGSFVSQQHAALGPAFTTRQRQDTCISSCPMRWQHLPVVIIVSGPVVMSRRYA